MKYEFHVTIINRNLIPKMKCSKLKTFKSMIRGKKRRENLFDICIGFSIGADTKMQLILHLEFLSKYEEYDDERSNELHRQEYHQVCEGKEMPFAQQTSFCPRYDDFEWNCVITTWLQMQNGWYKWFYTGTLIVIQVQVSWLFVICQTNGTSRYWNSFFDWWTFWEEGEGFIRNDIWSVEGMHCG